MGVNCIKLHWCYYFFYTVIKRVKKMNIFCTLEPKVHTCSNFCANCISTAIIIHKKQSQNIKKWARDKGGLSCLHMISGLHFAYRQAQRKGAEPLLCQCHKKSCLHYAKQHRDKLQNMTMIQNTKPSRPVFGYSRNKWSIWSGHLSLLTSKSLSHSVEISNVQFDTCKTAQDFTGTWGLLPRRMGSFTLWENKEPSTTTSKDSSCHWC